MESPPSPIDRSHTAMLRLLDRLDALPALDARTIYRPPEAAGDGIEDRIADAAARLPHSTGIVAFWGPTARLVVSPPFPVEKRASIDGYHTEPLRDLLNRPRTLAVILIRLGGYSVGIYRDGAFSDTKTGGRFVKNRNRKGGQSQRRFERIREGQTREHFDALGEVVRTKILPAAAELDGVVLGGDRRTVQAWLARAPLPPALASIVLPRVLDVPEPRLEVLQRTPVAIWSSRVVLDEPPPPAATEAGSAPRHSSQPQPAAPE